MTDHENGRRQTIRIPVPWGSGYIEIRGISVITSLTFTVVCMIGVMLYAHENIRDKDEDALVMRMDQLSARQQETTEAQRELNYIMTLTPEQRARLNLEMPDSLRKRMRSRDFERN